MLDRQEKMPLFTAGLAKEYSGKGKEFFLNTLFISATKVWVIISRIYS